MQIVYREDVSQQSEKLHQPRRVERRFHGNRRPRDLVRDLMKAHPQHP